jgi:putative transposase
MTSAQERKNILLHTNKAHRDGASWHRIADSIGLSARTLKRWRLHAEPQEDGRQHAKRPSPTQALSQLERRLIIETANQPEFASLPPSQIVPILAERGEYIASESTFYRVLKERNMLKHRGKARAPQKRKEPTTLHASAIGQVWTWDITWLPTTVNGQFYKLYVVMDLYSRKIIGWEIYEHENSDNSREVLNKAIASECRSPVYLHGDNGKPLKNATLHAFMLKHEIQPSHSRPRVSNDNAHAESLFRTVKYHPSLPDKPFANLSESREWMHGFTQWYNHEHRHKGIGMVTPEQKHAGEDKLILKKRNETYEKAKKSHPERWNGRETRKWSPVISTTLNPVSQRSIERDTKRAA